jgi:hypothetical protein
MSTLSKYARKWGREIARYPEKWGSEVENVFTGRRDANRLRDEMNRINAANRAEIDKIETPDLQFRRREIPQMGDYKPNIYEYKPETAPRTIEDSAAGKQGLAAQLETLRQMQDIAGRESDPRFEALLNRANRRTQEAAQGRSGYLQEQFARRGQLGSGMALAAQLSSASQAQDEAAELAQTAAAESYKNRLEAIMKSGELGRTIRTDEAEIQNKNAAIINDFNRRLSEGQNEYRKYAAETGNAATQYNDMNKIKRYALEVEQDIAENGIKSQKFQDMLAIAALRTGQNKEELQQKIMQAQTAAQQRSAILQVILTAGTAALGARGGKTADPDPTAAPAASSGAGGYNLGLPIFRNVTR